MNLYILQQYQFIQKLYNNKNFLDVLMNIDDFFDILHIYAFKNWLEAEVIDVKFLKYFTCLTIKTDRNDTNKEKDKCPDPKAGVILTKYDCKVEYTKSSETLPVEVKSEKDMVIDKKTGKVRPKYETKDIWLVEILIPNKHIINDNIYDIEAIQSKLEKSEDENEELDSVVSNGDEGANNV